MQRGSRGVLTLDTMFPICPAMNTTQTKRGPIASAPSGSRATAFVFQRSDLRA